MKKELILPVGQHPLDSLNSNIDPISFCLERVQTMLLWIDEHYSGFMKKRMLEQENAESELGYLKNANDQAILYLQRLTELLIQGRTVDNNKSIPTGLSSDTWLRVVDMLGPDRR